MSLSIIDFLRSDGSIIINKKLAHAVGIDAAIMYSEIISKQKYFEDRGQLTEDGFFFNTVEDMEKDTALSKYQQSKAIKKLIKEKLIFHQNRGLPQKRYFKVNDNEHYIVKVLEEGQKLKNSTSKSKKSEQLEGEKVDSNNTKFNNTKNNKIYLISANEAHVFKYYSLCYEEKFLQEHPTMNEEKMQQLINTYDEFTTELDISEETWMDLVDYHFNNLPEENNGNMLGFLNGCIHRYIDEI